MKAQLIKRLEDLKAEYETGQNKLVEFETQANNLRNALLRISGAIQVLEEELAKADQADPAADESAGDTVVAMH